MYFIRREVHKWEMMGAFVAIIGSLFIIIDPFARRVGQSAIAGVDGASTYYSNFSVDISLLISNAAASLLFALNKTLMKDRMLAHLFLVNLFTMMGFMVLTVLFENG